MARYIEDANFDFVETNKKLFCLKNYIQKELNLTNLKDFPLEYYNFVKELNFLFYLNNFPKYVFLVFDLLSKGTNF